MSIRDWVCIRLCHQTKKVYIRVDRNAVENLSEVIINAYKVQHSDIFRCIPDDADILDPSAWDVVLRECSGLKEVVPFSSVEANKTYYSDFAHKRLKIVIHAQNGYKVFGDYPSDDRFSRDRTSFDKSQSHGYVSQDATESSDTVSPSLRYLRSHTRKRFESEDVYSREPVIDCTSWVIEWSSNDESDSSISAQVSSKVSFRKDRPNKRPSGMIGSPSRTKLSKAAKLSQQKARLAVVDDEETVSELEENYPQSSTITSGIYQSESASDDKNVTGDNTKEGSDSDLPRGLSIAMETIKKSPGTNPLEDDLSAVVIESHSPVPESIKANIVDEPSVNDSLIMDDSVWIVPSSDDENQEADDSEEPDESKLLDKWASEPLDVAEMTSVEKPSSAADEKGASEEVGAEFQGGGGDNMEVVTSTREVDTTSPTSSPDTGLGETPRARGPYELNENDLTFVCPQDYQVNKLLLPSRERQHSINMEDASSHLVSLSRQFKFGKAHPTMLSEALGLSGLKGPSLPDDLKIHLPRILFERGYLSSIQFESITFASYMFHLQENKRKVRELTGLSSKSCSEPASTQETDVRNGTAHTVHLDEQPYTHNPDSNFGFWLSEGTGCGKGRIIAGLILHLWQKGYRRHLWLSVNNDLVKDAIRDFQALGAFHIPIISLLGVDANLDLTSSEGEWTLKKKASKGGWNYNGQAVLFCPYLTLTSAKGRRIPQLVKWFNEKPPSGGNTRTNVVNQKILTDGKSLVKYFLSERHCQFRLNEKRGLMRIWTESLNSEDSVPLKYYGLIAADECHKLKRFAGTGKTGSKIGSGTIELIRRVPDSFVIYSSATAASDIANLRYIERLGMWGPGSGFKTFSDFQHVLEREGEAGLECVVMDLKAEGRLTCRQLSFYGVMFSTVLAPLDDKFINSYNHCSNLVKTLLRCHLMIDKMTARNPFPMITFWADAYKLFKHLVICVKVDTAVELTRKLLLSGRQVVLSLWSTGASAASDERLTNKPSPLSSPATTIFKRRLKQLQAHFSLISEDASDFESMRAVMADVEKRTRDVMQWMPNNPLDELINRLGGSNNVAEITGRPPTLRTATGSSTSTGDLSREESDVSWPGGTIDGKKEAARALSINIAETQDFQRGRKKVAIISEAASAGISLHASNEISGVRPRSMICLEFPWAPDKAVQQMGRVHRSNQLCPSEYYIMVSNVGGEARFTSTIAKRLKSLGAICRGDAVSMSIFQSKSRTANDSPKSLATEMNYVEDGSNSNEIEASGQEESSLVLDLPQMTSLDAFRACEALYRWSVLNKQVDGERSDNKRPFETLVHGVIRPPLHVLRKYGISSHSTLAKSIYREFDDNGLGSDIMSALDSEKYEGNRDFLNRFLNRLLIAELPLQNIIFDFFCQIVNQGHAVTIANGRIPASLNGLSMRTINLGGGIVEYPAKLVGQQSLCAVGSTKSESALFTIQFDRGVPWAHIEQLCAKALKFADEGFHTLKAAWSYKLPDKDETVLLHLLPIFCIRRAALRDLGPPRDSSGSSTASHLRDVPRDRPRMPSGARLVIIRPDMGVLGGFVGASTESVDKLRHLIKEGEMKTVDLQLNLSQVKQAWERLYEASATKCWHMLQSSKCYHHQPCQSGRFVTESILRGNVLQFHGLVSECGSSMADNHLNDDRKMSRINFVRAVLSDPPNTIVAGARLMGSKIALIKRALTGKLERLVSMAMEQLGSETQATLCRAAARIILLSVYPFIQLIEGLCTHLAERLQGHEETRLDLQRLSDDLHSFILAHCRQVNDGLLNAEDSCYASKVKLITVLKRLITFIGVVTHEKEYDCNLIADISASLSDRALTLTRAGQLLEKNSSDATSVDSGISKSMEGWKVRPDLFCLLLMVAHPTRRSLKTVDWLKHIINICARFTGPKALCPLQIDKGKYLLIDLRFFRKTRDNTEPHKEWRRIIRQAVLSSPTADEISEVFTQMGQQLRNDFVYNNPRKPYIPSISPLEDHKDSQMRNRFIKQMSAADPILSRGSHLLKTAPTHYVNNRSQVLTSQNGGGVLINSALTSAGIKAMNEFLNHNVLPPPQYVYTWLGDIRRAKELAVRCLGWTDTVFNLLVAKLHLLKNLWSKPSTPSFPPYSMPRHNNPADLPRSTPVVAPSSLKPPQLVPLSKSSFPAPKVPSHSILSSIPTVYPSPFAPINKALTPTVPSPSPGSIPSGSLLSSLPVYGGASNTSILPAVGEVAATEPMDNQRNRVGAVVNGSPPATTAPTIIPPTVTSDSYRWAKLNER